MRTKAFIAGALALAIAAAPAMAQQPNFSGAWTLVPDPNAAGGGGGGRGGGGGLGQAATLTQDAKTLTVTRTTQNGEVKMVYNLDGSESKNMVMGRGGQTEQVSKAVWDGAKLVITTSFTMGENAVTRTQTMSLDASGQLVVTVAGPGRGGEMMTTTQTYKKG
jgi:Spy/CpxP family protein refolding chaperone